MNGRPDPPADGAVPPARRVARTRHVAGRAPESGEDAVVVEEPLEIRAGGAPLLVTLRTPGDDLDLARGLLFTEGFVDRPDEVAGVVHCEREADGAPLPPEARGNVVLAQLAGGASIDPARRRVLLRNAACGLCGAQTLAQIRAACKPVAAGPAVDGAVLRGLPETMRRHQTVFETTGGLHAAGLFEPDGRLLLVKEDVGRHNAVDKVIGAAMRFGLLPLSRAILLLSGRAGFELVQKARRAGIPVVAAVSAPSSLAVALAADGNQTLIGFLRGEAFTVYAGAERVIG